MSSPRTAAGRALLLLHPDALTTEHLRQIATDIEAESRAAALAGLYDRLVPLVRLKDQTALHRILAALAEKQP